MASSIRKDLLSPAAVAMFDVLADGDEHATVALMQIGARAALEADFEAALAIGRSVRSRYWSNRGDTLTDDEIASTGAARIAQNCLYKAARRARISRQGDRVRMFAHIAEEWRAIRPSLTIPIETLKFGGLPEWEGWLFAPLKERELVHFRTDNNADIAKLRARLRRKLGDSILVTSNGDGLVNIVTGNSAKVREEVQCFCDGHGLRAKSLRTEPKVRRRDIERLPAGFMEDLLGHYGRIAAAIMLGKRNLIVDAVPAADADDIRQHAQIIVMEAASRYDDSSGVPFDAFVADRVRRAITDMARETWGRGGTDTVRRYQQSIDAFVEQNGYEPSTAELAEFTGKDVEDLLAERNLVTSMSNVREAMSIHDDDGRAIEDKLDHGDHDTVEQRLIAEERQTAISKALTAAAVDGDPVGWAVVYLQTWQSGSQSRIAKTLGVSEDRVRESSNQLRESMREHLSEMAS